MKFLERTLFGLICVLVGMFVTIGIYLKMLGSVGYKIEQLCPTENIVGSGSFFRDWPLDIIFPGLPALGVMIIAWLVVWFLVKKRSTAGKK